MKYNLIFSFVRFALVIIALAGCSVRSQKQQLPIPDRQVVFQTEVEDTYALGFINLDGSEPTILKTEYRASIPTWSSDGERIFSFDSDQYPGDARPMYGQVYITYPDKVVRCIGWVVWDEIYPLPERDLAFYMAGGEVGTFNVRTCKKEEVWFQVESEAQTSTLLDAAPSREGRFIMLTIGDYLYLYDVEGKQLREIVEGYNGRLSPDDHSVAYIHDENLYVFDLQDGEKRILVSHDKSAFNYGDGYYSPVPSWSPDGEWVVYHECIKGDCNQSVGDYGIFRVRVSDGKEEKLYEGGLYPFVR